ncbi:hypothetical protein BDR22DRAFT_848931 [Usnea florida]
MKNAPTLPKKSPRRFKFKTVSFEDSESEEIYFPYAQCLCDLDESVTQGHAPTCPQLHISPYHQAAYPEVEGDAAGPRGRRGKSESNKRKGTSRRQQKKEKRLRDIEARSEMLKAAKQATEPSAQCRCSDGFSDSEEEALRGQSRMFYDGDAGGCPVHSPRCRKRRLDHITPRGPKSSPPKSTSYIDLEEKETTGSRRKKKRTARLPPKSKEYIDLEDEDEGGEGSASVPAISYDPKTIASDFLRAIGKHPYLPPLNAHMEELPTSTKSRSSNSYI